MNVGLKGQPVSSVDSGYFLPINYVFFRLRRREFEKNHLICRIDRMIFIEGDTLTIGKNSDNEKTLR